MTLTKAPAKRPTTSHRKLAGQHHKQTHHYGKSYWPYLPVLAILVGGFLLNGLVHRVHHSVLGYATNVSSQVLLSDSNVQRAHQNEPALKLNSELTAAAQAKANDMARRNYWSHVTPDGKQPWAFIDNTGYQYQSAGENLAYGFGTSDEVMAGWMQSTEHRDNILNAKYSDVGFATANVANYQGQGPATIVVAEYAQPTDQLAVTAYVKGPAPTVTVATTAQPVSRLQTVASNQGLQLAVAAICGAAIVLFIVRHGRAWHKRLVRGEQFVLHHPLFDVVLASIVVLAFLLLPTVGTIL